MAKKKKQNGICRIFVSGEAIRQNQRNGKSLPTIIVEVPSEKENGEQYDKMVRAHEVIILGQDGKEAARVVYRPDGQRAQGQVVYVEAERVEVK